MQNQIGRMILCERNLLELWHAKPLIHQSNPMPPNSFNPARNFRGLSERTVVLQRLSPRPYGREEQRSTVTSALMSGVFFGTSVVCFGNVLQSPEYTYAARDMLTRTHAPQEPSADLC